MNMLNFCTLFDSYYLTRGIALYQSLEKYCDNFHLYIFAFDDNCFTVLKKMNLSHATIITLAEFENANLLRVKPTRTIAEYCWTCTASTIWYSIHKYQLAHCTYLDADLLFFSSPQPIYDEIGDKSVGLTPHNYSSRFRSSEELGKYCVQFTYFKNDVDGINALNWWKENCIEWCYAKMENGKYGDQKYLDYFHDKFNNVYDIKNIGVGVAPWNIDNYTIQVNNDSIWIDCKYGLSKPLPLIFYHYQGLKFNEQKEKVYVTPYFFNIPKVVLNHIYTPYVYHLLIIKNQLTKQNDIEWKIIFKKNTTQIIFTFISMRMKRFFLVRKIYYYFQKKRYNRPKDIGGNV